MRKQADPKMPDDTEPPNNVVSLGTESMVAIAEGLRKMYATYLREKPPNGSNGSCAGSSVARTFRARMTPRNGDRSARRHAQWAPARSKILAICE